MPKDGDIARLETYSEEKQQRFRDAWSGFGFSDDHLPLAQPVTAEEVVLLQEQVFGADCFSVTQVDHTPIGTFFRGKLRRNAPNVSATVQVSIQCPFLVFLQDMTPKAAFQLHTPPTRLNFTLACVP